MIIFLITLSIPTIRKNEQEISISKKYNLQARSKFRDHTRSLSVWTS